MPVNNVSASSAMVYPGMAKLQYTLYCINLIKRPGCFINERGGGGGGGGGGDGGGRVI